ncbi:uncharacterized protein HD556DRAFT_1449156 [Suillus plorans]|uniref:Uncharacterized protein n=1 Tax=Suillus plorans TaxID=116603 RepID=A0A9P7DCC9_9AGAM|nr:uncharacterized protein HD556DRAFT_1449156 [Suillus plorans]KAG1787101.1 hypothetical protein HD556DRAFT_1449156 [Suillus plorans]
MTFPVTEFMHPDTPQMQHHNPPFSNLFQPNNTPYFPDPPAYMRMHQQIQALVSENKTLKQQNNALLGSQDAYKNAFTILATSISLDVGDSDIAKFSGIPPGAKHAIYKPSFHEQKRAEPLRQNGDPVQKFEVSRITKSLRSCWAALKQENRAPDTWGKAGNKILDEVAEEMAHLHPILALCENGWKSQITGDKSTTLSESQAKQDTPVLKDITTTPILNLQNGSKSDIGTSEQEQQSNDTQQPPSIEASTPSPQPGPVSLPVPRVSLTQITTHDTSNSPEASSHANTAGTTSQDRLNHSNDTVNTSTGITEGTETPVEVTYGTMTSFPVIKNPLAKLAERKRESTVPNPAVTPSDVPASLSAPTLPPKDMPVPAASAAVESAASAKKFQPGTSKNGRSLCAHRWLKQIAANGSSANFRIYWSGLTKEKQVAYESDALKLVKDDIWNGNTVDIISKISSGTLH